MRNSLLAAKKYVDKALDVFAVGLFILIFAVVLLQVFMRYALGSPLVWSEELARYLFIWVAFIGWVFATRSGTHIKISAVFDALPKGFQKVVGAFNNSLIFLFNGILAILGFRMVEKSFDIPTVTLFFTYGFVYVIVPVSCLLIAFYAAINLVSGTVDKGGTIL